MDQDTLRQLISAEVRRAIVPLETEIQWLKAELQSLKASNGQAPVAAPTASVPLFEVASEPAATPAASEESLPGNVPPDRSDFARFLARGLEQEAREYSEEKMQEAEPKKRGWNPFKR